MHVITIVPTLRTVARQVLSSHHATRGMVQSILSLTLSSRRLHSQFPDSSTEDSYLSVLKNKISDTRGLNFYCIRFLRVFLQDL